MKKRDDEIRETIKAILGEGFLHILMVGGGCGTSRTHTANTGCNKFTEEDIQG